MRGSRWSAAEASVADDSAGTCAGLSTAVGASSVGWPTGAEARRRRRVGGVGGWKTRPKADGAAGSCDGAASVGASTVVDPVGVTSDATSAGLGRSGLGLGLVGLGRDRTDDVGGLSGRRQVGRGDRLLGGGRLAAGPLAGRAGGLLGGGRLGGIRRTGGVGRRGRVGLHGGGVALPGRVCSGSAEAGAETVVSVVSAGAAAGAAAFLTARLRGAAAFFAAALRGRLTGAGSAAASDASVAVVSPASVALGVSAASVAGTGVVSCSEAMRRPSQAHP